MELSGLRMRIWSFRNKKCRTSRMQCFVTLSLLYILCIALTLHSFRIRNIPCILWMSGHSLQGRNSSGYKGKIMVISKRVNAGNYWGMELIKGSWKMVRSWRPGLEVESLVCWGRRGKPVCLPSQPLGCLWLLYQLFLPVVEYWRQAIYKGRKPLPAHRCSGWWCERGQAP